MVCKESKVMETFKFKKTVIMTICEKLNLENFLYQSVSGFPLHGLSFGLKLGMANPCLAHLNFFFTKTCFSVRNTNSSVNFILFHFSSARDSKKDFWNTLFDLSPFQEATNQIFLEIKIILAFKITEKNLQCSSVKFSCYQFIFACIEQNPVITLQI